MTASRTRSGASIVGNREVISGIITCLLTRGHVLLEGIPGLGKTKIVQTLSEAMHLKFNRVQFTPDLMPGDIVGTNVVRETETGAKILDFQPGPIFCNLMLADEVNRATPKSQSALLEAMQEKSVSIGNTTHKLQEPFFVMATQNPIELEGTYPLPEAQMDRFLMKLRIGYPNHEELREIGGADNLRRGAAGPADRDPGRGPRDAGHRAVGAHCPRPRGLRHPADHGVPSRVEVRPRAHEPLCEVRRQPAGNPGARPVREIQGAPRRPRACRRGRTSATASFPRCATGCCSTSREKPTRWTPTTSFKKSSPRSRRPAPDSPALPTGDAAPYALRAPGAPCLRAEPGSEMLPVTA